MFLKEIDRLTAFLLVSLLVVILSIPFIVQFSLELYPDPETDPSPPSPGDLGVELIHPNSNEGNYTGWWRDSDVIIWMWADSQPYPNRSSHIQRLENSAQDIDSLPFEPDYIVAAGDITDAYRASVPRYNNSTPEQNIRKTLSTLEEISWFNEKLESGDAMILRGNHERGHEETFAAEFNSDCDGEDRLSTIRTELNVVIYGACGTSTQSVSYNKSFAQLESELRRLNDTDTDWNALTAFHQPVPETVSNCHTVSTNGSIEWMDAESREKYLKISKDYPDTLTATFTGHIHGRWDDVGRAMVSTSSQTYVDLPVFGTAIMYSAGGVRCNSRGRGSKPIKMSGFEKGVGDSMFLSLQEGNDTAEIYIRHSCDDFDYNGECDHEGYWEHGEIPLRLDHPVKKVGG